MRLLSNENEGRMKYNFALMLGVFLLLLVGCHTPIGDVGQKTAWKLHFSDDFNRSDIGGEWKVCQGDWSVKNGSLQGSGCIISTRGFPDDSWGFTRLEYEVETDANTKLGFSGLGALIHARPPEKFSQNPWAGGYLFKFGDSTNTSNKIWRDGKEIATDLNMGTLIGTDNVHRIILENDQGELRLIVDDKLIVECKDNSPFFAGKDYNRIGFYFENNAKVRNVKVYIKRMDDRDMFL